jgi:hypothetical protein
MAKKETTREAEVKEETKEVSKDDAVEIPVGKYVNKARNNPWVVSTFVLGIFLVAVLIFNIGFRGGVTGNAVSEDTLGQSLVSFVEARTGETPTVNSVEKENNFYKVTLSLQGQDVPVYMTLDGKYLIPGQPISLTEEIPASDGSDTTTPTPTNIPKTDKPVVEAFVMSHCPYGTQIEKGLIPVVELLGDKIDFKVKFVYYAMHGEKEVKEELNQYCIEKEQNDKYLPYLKCFLDKGDGAACLTTAKVNKVKLDACTKAADKQFNVMANFNDKENWLSGQFPLFDIYKADNEKYKVAGSPTLIINGVQASSGRDSASLLKAVCGAFSTAPEECAEELSSASPSAGFGYSTTTAATTASCG